MPFYEYRCKACDHRFEVLQRMSDEPVSVCEACGAEEAERVLFAPAIHFKGSGFHNTDYGTRRRPVGGDSSDSGAATTTSTGTGTGGASSNGAGSSGGSSDSAGSSSSSSKSVGLDKV